MVNANHILLIKYNNQGVWRVATLAGADSACNTMDRKASGGWRCVAAAYLGKCSSVPLHKPNRRHVVPRGAQLLEG